MGQSANRDPFYPGLSARPERLERDAAARLELCTTRHLGHGGAQLLIVHVVEQQPRRAGGERLLDLLRARDLDLEAASYRPSVGHRLLDEAPDAVTAERMVRAGEPNVPAWTTVAGQKVYVRKAAVAPDCGNGPGLTFPDGCLRLLDYEPATD